MTPAEARRNGLTPPPMVWDERGERVNPSIAGMFAPVQCKHCGCVHDSGPVEVVQRYADCSVWRCPGCRVLVDDRDPRWGGGVYKLDRQGRRT